MVYFGHIDRAIFIDRMVIMPEIECAARVTKIVGHPTHPSAPPAVCGDCRAAITKIRIFIGSKRWMWSAQRTKCETVQRLMFIACGVVVRRTFGYISIAQNKWQCM